MTGKTKKRHGVKNKRRRLNYQENQGGGKEMAPMKTGVKGGGENSSRSSAVRKTSP